jgi:hypothetical protein
MSTETSPTNLRDRASLTHEGGREGGGRPMVNMTKELCENFWFTSHATASRRRFVKHRIDDIRVLVDEAMCPEDSLGEHQE